MVGHLAPPMADQKAIAKALLKVVQSDDWLDLPKAVSMVDQKAAQLVVWTVDEWAALMAEM